MKSSAHKKVVHTDIDEFGFDWGKIGDPNIESSPPLRLMFPNSLDELRAIFKELSSSSQFIIRASAHSNNDLVTGSRDTPVVSMLKMNSIEANGNSIIQEINNEKCVVVESGCDIGDIEDELFKEGYSLPVVPDHRHITVGGLASVGGISAASHKHGLFIDNILQMTLLTKDSEDPISVGPEKEEIYKYAGKAGQGSFIIAKLALRVQEVNKRTSMLRREFKQFSGLEETTDLNTYADLVVSLANNMPETYSYFRGMWLNLPQLGPRARGIISYFELIENPTGENWLTRSEKMRELEVIGHHTGSLPPEIESMETQLKLIAWLRLAQDTPEFQTYEDVEFFTDKVIDASVGTPTYMLTLIIPANKFKKAISEVQTICDGELGHVKHGKGFAMYALYSRVINSSFLRGPQDNADSINYVDISLFVGMNLNREGNIIEGTIEKVAAKFDDLAEALNEESDNLSFRYMCTLTKKFRPSDNDKRDPSSQW